MKVLFFSPHAATWIHAFPEALVADALMKQGHDVIYITCGRTFNRFCVPMTASGVAFDSTDEARARICERCERNARLLQDELQLQGQTLSDILTPSDYEETNAILAGMSPKDITTLARDGIELGRVALYQLVLRNKRNDLDLSEREWREYLVELKHTIYAWLAVRRLLDIHRPDRIVVYNGLYSVNRAATLLAEARGIPSYFLHAGSNLSNRLQSLMIARSDTFVYLSKIIADWRRFADVPCSHHLLSQVTDHFIETTRARSVFAYSKERSHGLFDVRSHFGIGQDQKIIIAAMSSNDEEAAGLLVGAQPPRRPPVFPTQIEWIRAVLDFIAARPELFLIIRVHPREFPNRREGVTSQHAQQLQQSLLSLPPNARVNWPADNISLYDLVDQADLFLNAWSSVGKDVALLGMPVVLYGDDLTGYPAELNRVGTTLEDYFSEIDGALAEGWNFDYARRAYRWNVYEFVRCTVFIGDSYPELEHISRSVPRKVIDRIQSRLDPDFRQHRDLKRRLPHMQAEKQIDEILTTKACCLPELMDPEQVEQASFDEETAALRVELKRLADALFPAPEFRKLSRLYGRLVGEVVPS